MKASYAAFSASNVVLIKHLAVLSVVAVANIVLMPEVRLIGSRMVPSKGASIAAISC